MENFDIGILVTLVLYGLTQIGGGVALLSHLRTRSANTEQQLTEVKVTMTAMQARFDAKLESMRSEVHGDLSAIRGEMTRLAVEVGKTIGRQDASRG